MAIWQNAIDYCENLSLDGKSDWGLPNVNELVSLVDDKTYLTIDAIFQNTTGSYYWSSTTCVNDNSNAWLFELPYSTQNYSKVAYSHPVRCVRAGQ